VTERASSYRDLEVYQIAHRLGVELHRFSLSLPKYELYETGSQLRRASKSFSANIVEGYGRRRYKADYIRFLVYAHSSCDETIEWVQYTKKCHADHAEAAEEYLAELDTLGRKLNPFLQSVEASHRSEK